MKTFLFVSLFAFSFAALSSGFPLEKQNPWLGNADLDVESYDLNLVVTALDASEIQATLTMKLKTLRTTSSLKFHFDATALQISEAQLNQQVTVFKTLAGIPGNFKLTGDVLEIVSATELAAESTHTLKLTYTIQINRSGDEGFSYESDILSTRSWPYYTRTWMPSNDHPNDVATFAVTATVPQDFSVLSNGELTQTHFTEEEQARYRWELNVPIPTYDMTVVVGKFVHHTRSICFNLSGASSDQAVDCAVATSNVPATFYIPANHSQTQSYLSHFGKSNSSLIWFANILGEYEYPKSGFVVAPHPFSMEHASLITLVNPRSAVHEVAHHWWGNTVHIAHWGDFWISEGFTTYMDGLYDEYLTGKDSSCRQTSGKLNASADTDPMTIFDNTPYCKGAAALNGLRETMAQLVGQSSQSDVVKSLLYQTLRSIYQAHRFKKLSTEGLGHYLEQNLPAILANESNATPEEVRSALKSWQQQWFEI